MDAFDARLSPLGDYLWEKRSTFLQDWLPVFTEQYHYFVDSDEQPAITYRLQEESLSAQLADKRQADLQAQRTTCGPHTDDLEFSINGFPLKKAGSQGQQKSFLVALKLAQWKVWQQTRGLKPVLLLDDLLISWIMSAFPGYCNS